MNRPMHNIQRKLDIALALAENLLPEPVRGTVSSLPTLLTYQLFKAVREKALAQIKDAVAEAQDSGQRPDALQAFRSLLLEGIFIDAMAVLAVESRIAAFKAEHAPPAAVTVSEHEQP